MKEYKRKGIIVLLLISILLSLVRITNVQAHNRDVHDNHLNSVLFVDSKIPNNPEELDKLELIEDAVYLCLDQYNGDGAECLEHLKNEGIHNLPSDITEIDFRGNQYHRKYTHRGWDFNYDKDDQANWSVRKEILLSTNCYVFGFDENMSENDYSDKCNSLCALMYYVHVLGDEQTREEFTKDDEDDSKEVMIHFAHSVASDKSPDLLSEITNHLTILFHDQRYSFKYISMMYKINALAYQARKVSAVLNSVDGKDSSEAFDRYKQCEEDLMDLLQSYVPKLLRREEFFKTVFSVWE